MRGRHSRENKLYRDGGTARQWGVQGKFGGGGQCAEQGMDVVKNSE